MAKLSLQKTALIWLRRDLRLSDNPALFQASTAGFSILPVFVYAPEEETLWAPGAAARWWLHHSLESLSRDFKRAGSKLTVRRGPTLETLLDLCKETGANTVYWNRLYDPAIIKRDTHIKSELTANGIEAQSFNGTLLKEPWEIASKTGTPYKVFTPFYKNYQAHFALNEPSRPLDVPALHSVKKKISSIRIKELELKPSIKWYTHMQREWSPGTASALELLRQFLESGAVTEYGTGRDLPAANGISRLSASLHFGEISARQIWHATRQAAIASREEDAVEPYLRQLIWREFANHLLYHFPHTPEKAFNAAYNDFPWTDDAAVLGKWQAGETGLPLVDAGMRELWQTGWMHNRVRMNVASYLTKNAMVPWQHGARWFWDTLIDANLANNTMGWQWAAGCGADAAPFFRIFNPARQGERFDPHGEYIRKWIPELDKLPDKYIQAPWTAPGNVLTACGVSMGKTYPNPILDLKQTRERALAEFKTFRGGA